MYDGCVCVVVIIIRTKASPDLCFCPVWIGWVAALHLCGSSCFLAGPFFNVTTMHSLLMT